MVITRLILMRIRMRTENEDEDKDKEEVEDEEEDEVGDQVELHQTVQPQSCHLTILIWLKTNLNLSLSGGFCT